MTRRSPYSTVSEPSDFGTGCRSGAVGRRSGAKIMIEKIEIEKKYYTFSKCHRILRGFPKYDGLTPSESLDAGLCTRTLRVGVIDFLR